MDLNDTISNQSLTPESNDYDGTTIPTVNQQIEALEQRFEQRFTNFEREIRQMILQLLGKQGIDQAQITAPIVPLVQQQLATPDKGDSINILPVLTTVS